MKEKLLKIFDMVYTLNATTQHSLFYQYHGHVNSLSVLIFEGGWEEHANISITLEAYMNDWNADAERDLDNIIKKLEEYK